jgi:predicted RecB family endonuclease
MSEIGNSMREVIIMSYVDPSVRKQFDTLSPELQKAILVKDVSIRSLKDLIKVLENFVSE